MKISWDFTKRFTRFAIVFALGLETAYASIYDVTIDTSPIQSTAGFMAFDFIDGDGFINNSITISNFSSDAALLTEDLEGDVSGTLNPGPMVIGDGDFFNEMLQEVTFGTFVNFRVETTGNGPFGPTPDSFAFFLLDSGFFPYPTTDPLGTDALMVVDIDNAQPVPQVFASASASAAVSLVPLPGALVFLISGLLALAGVARKTAGRR